jgi:hypothetical protein
MGHVRQAANPDKQFICLLGFFYRRSSPQVAFQASSVSLPFPVTQEHEL